MKLYLFITLFLGLGLFHLVIKIGDFLQKKIQFLHDPVYVPSLDAAAADMIALAKPTQKDVVADLGSGNGKLVIDFASLAKKTVGYEIDPFLVFESRRKIKTLNLTNASIKWQSFWKADFSEYDVILLYMTASIMEKLEQKLQAELKPGARIVSQRFTFPNWHPEKKQGDCTLYIQK